MRHEVAIEILFASIAGMQAGEAPRGADRAAAEEHVSRCSDCWAAFASRYEALTGASPPGSERMDALYGCGAVQEKLDRLVALGPIESRARHPDTLRHLGWCHACRERLADLLAFDGAVPASPAVRELLGRLRVRVRRGLASLAEIPSGFVLVAEPAPAMRAASVPEPRAETSSKARFDLPDGGRSGEVFVNPDGEDAVRLTVQLSSSGGDDFTVYLRTASGEDTNLLAAQTARPGTPVILRQVPAGAYVLEITENIRGGRTRLALEVAVDGEEGVLR